MRLGHLHCHYRAVTDILLAVAYRIPRPRLAVLSADKTSLRLPQARKSDAGQIFCALRAHQESNLDWRFWRPLFYH